MSAVYLKVTGLFKKSETHVTFEIQKRNFKEEPEHYVLDEPDAYFPVKITKRQENLLKLFNMEYSIYRIVDEAEIQENLFEMKGLIRDGLLELTEKQKEKILAELEYVDAKLASIENGSEREDEK